MAAASLRLERELHAAEGITTASVNLDPGQAIVVGSVDAEAALPASSRPQAFQACDVD